MSNAASLSHALTTILGLETPPVALQYVTAAPSGVEVDSGPVPAGCSFWRRGESGTRFTPAEAHSGCAVGMHTQGLTMSAETATELGGLITTMGEVGYLEGSEVAAIPTVTADRTGRTGGIVEGPLADAGSLDDVDVVLVWADAQQAMLLNEAAGGAAWGGPGTAVFGRPACAALPAAMQSGRVTVSFGCAGMRTFTEVARERMLVVIPGATLRGLAARVDALGAANTTMDAFYAARK